MSKEDIVGRIVENFPQELRELDQWVVWRSEVRGDKPTKVPYNAHTGGGAMSDNPSTWTSFGAACNALLHGNYDGVGFVFSEYDPYCGIDFDNCVDENGGIDDDKRAWVMQLASYGEYSVSGTGAHIIVRGRLPDGGRRSKRHNIEMYDQKRFFVVTGDHIVGTPSKITDRQTEIERIHAEIFPPQQPQTSRKPVVAGSIPHDDRALLEKMFTAKNGAEIRSLWNGDLTAYNDDDSAADLALCNHLSFWTGNDAERIDRLFRQSGLFREKWDRAARMGETYGAGTIARAIAATNNVYNPAAYRNGSNGTGNGHHGAGGVVDNPQPPSQHDKTNIPSESIPVDPLRYRAEDGGIMDAWLDSYGDDWIYIVGPDAWHQWENTHWEEDKELNIKELITDMMDSMNRRCSEIMKDAPGKIKNISGKYAAASLEIPDAAIKEIERIKADADIAKAMKMATRRSGARVGSVESMSRNKRAVATSKMNIDDSLNMANGVLSLRSLELQLHDRQDLFTYCLNYDYDPSAKCPLWEQFISEVLVKEGTTETDAELVLLFQELLGYSLTPDTKREVMAWMFGEGGNGKSVAIHVIKSLLGPMAMPIDFQSIGQPGNYDLADVPGKRVLLSTESERGKPTSERHIKQIVTGDPMKARPIYGSSIVFSSTAKIWWAMNDKPVIKDTTDSMWRRMKLIPFHRKFEEGKNADVDLPRKLDTELPGILNWAIAGLIRLTNNGRFTTSTASEDAKQQYREEANPVAQWVNTMTVPTSHPATLQSALFKEYTAWCRDQNEYIVSSTQFGKDLKRLKIGCARKTAGWMYNIALVDNIRQT